MTVYGPYTFPEANGSALTSPWIVNLLGTGSFHYFRVEGNTAEGNQSNAAYNGQVATHDTTVFGDIDIKGKITFNATDAESYPAIGFRMAGGTNGWFSPWGEVNNGYCVYLSNLSNLMALQRLSGGTEVASWNATGIVIGGGQSWWLRVKVVGSLIKAKAWQDGSAEPTTGGPAGDGFQISQTDTTYASGRVGLRCQAQSVNVKTRWDDVTLDDLVAGGAFVDLDDLNAAGMGVGAPAVARLAPIRELVTTAAGMGVGSAPVARLAPIRELVTAAGAMGVGSAPVARLAPIRELVTAPAGMGAAAAPLGVSLTRELELAPAGLGVGAAPLARLHLIRELDPAPAGMGAAATEATMAPIRELVGSAAGMGAAAAPVARLHLLLELDPAPAGMGAAATEVPDLLETVDLVLLDDLAPAGLGLGASTASLGVLRSLEVAPAGLGATAAPVPSLAPIRGLLLAPAGLGVAASEALLAPIRELGLAPAGLGVGASPVDHLLRTLELALAPAGLGVAASEVPTLNLGEARASWRTYAIVDQARGHTVATLVVAPYTLAATLPAETGASNR